MPHDFSLEMRRIIYPIAVMMVGRKVLKYSIFLARKGKEARFIVRHSSLFHSIHSTAIFCLILKGVLSQPATVSLLTIGFLKEVSALESIYFSVDFFCVAWRAAVWHFHGRQYCVSLRARVSSIFRCGLGLQLAKWMLLQKVPTYTFLHKQLG